MKERIGLNILFFFHSFFILFRKERYLNVGEERKEGGERHRVH